jgi:hypothetical protein
MSAWARHSAVAQPLRIFWKPRTLRREPSTPHRQLPLTVSAKKLREGLRGTESLPSDNFDRLITLRNVMLRVCEVAGLQYP